MFNCPKKPMFKAPAPAASSASGKESSSLLMFSSTSGDESSQVSQLVRSEVVHH